MAEGHYFLLERRNEKDPATIGSVQRYDGKQAVYTDPDMFTDAFAEEYASAQSSVAIITPPSGYRVCIRDVYVVTEANNGEIRLDFATSGKKVHRHYAAAQYSSTISGGHTVGATNEPLSLTTTTGSNNVFVRVVYIFHR